jgi:hypothetical protein
MYICMYECMYIQYIQGLCQSRLSTANHALLLISPATTAVSYGLKSQSQSYFTIGVKPLETHDQIFFLMENMSIA